MSCEATSRTTRVHGRQQRGSALVMALFVVTLLTGMGTALLFLSQHESRMSKAGLRAKRAFYLAEAGLENGRMTLYETNGEGSFDDDLEDAAGPDGVIDFDPATLEPTYDSSGYLTGFTGFDDDVPVRGMTALNSFDGQGWYAAFLTNDHVEGVTSLTDGNQRVMITAVGAGQNESLEVVQAIVEPFRFLPPVPPAALTMLGPKPAFFDNGKSMAQDHTGNDCGVTGGAYAPIIGTVSPESREQVQKDMNRPEAFEAGPFAGEDTVADLTDLTDPIVDAAGHGIIDPLWVSCNELKTLVEDLALSADYYCNTDVSSCTIPNLPAVDSIVFIDGDLSTTPAGTYTGLLVVTGELVYNGATNWNGVVMAVGEGRLIRSGGGNGNPSGGVIVAAIDPTPSGPAADKSDWCAKGFDQAFYDASGGGAATIEWCSSHLNATNSVRTYRITQFLQR